MRRLLVALLLALGVVGAASAQLGIPTPAATFSPVTVLPMATRAAGAYNFQGVNVPTGVVGLDAIIDVSQATEPLPQIDTILEGSRDGGATWGSAGSVSRPPGNKTVVRGVTIQIVGVTVSGGPFWSDTANSQRQLRGLATLGGSMRFALTVTPQ